MEPLKQKLKQMALTPKAQLKKVAIGTVGSLLCMFILILTSPQENQWLFYGLSVTLFFFIIYAIPGYIGIWVWRMRKFLFDMD